MNSTLVLASLSPIKYRALIQALNYLQLNMNIVQVNAASNVSEVPQGLEETYLGASQRANNAIILLPNGDYYLGIESGLIHLGQMPPIDLAICVLRTQEKQLAVASSSGLMFPATAVQAAQTDGIKNNYNALTTKGCIIKEGDPCDPHKTISHGLLPRELQLMHGIIATLVHICV